MAPLMLLFLWLFYPVGYPLARVLDYLTDEGSDVHRQDETYNPWRIIGLGEDST
jgi:CBS domain containing-hemolysin-like protein